MKFLKTVASDDMQLKMTAMIDVVFQLLIFFLVGTKFRVPEGELPADLPEKGGPERPVELVDEIRVTLKVAMGGVDNPDVPPAVFLDDKGMGPGSPTGSMAWLDNQLRDLGRDPRMRESVPVIIEAEPGLAYKWVIETLNLCRKAKFVKVNFAASKRNTPERAGAPPSG